MHAEDVPLPRDRRAVGTPVYVYSRATLTRHARVFREGLAGVERTHIAYAIKANPNLAVLRVLAEEGYGADVVSGGEMRARAGGGHAARGHRLFRRRQDPRRAGRARSMPGSASSTSSSRKKARCSPRSPQRGGTARRRGAARQPRCRCRHPCQDLDRQGGEQVRRADRPGARHLRPARRRCPGSTCAASRSISAASSFDLAPLEAAYRPDRRAGRRTARRRPSDRPRRSRRRARRALQARRRAAEPGRLWRDGRARDQGLGRRR